MTANNNLRVVVTGRPVARERDGFAELLGSIRNCTVCEAHLPFAAKPIFQLHPEARILIASQAPGRHAHDSGLPFDDASGRRLRGWLGVDSKAFYEPRNFAILPMGFCFPGTGRSGDRPPRPECSERWRQKVLQQLVKVELTLLIGQYAQRWHLSMAPKQRLVDSVRNWQNYWPETLPMPHPSPRNRSWLQQQPWFENEVLPQLRERVARLIRT